MTDLDSLERKTTEFLRHVTALREQMAKVIVGHTDIIDGVLSALLGGSHVLVEGVPGLGKTLLVRTLADCLNVEFSRIQFTPDLMPADIIGSVLLAEGSGQSSGRASALEFRKGPLFANIVLADEINRATPKTQSALLEAMQEQRVTVARTTYTLDLPYFVLATQNPLEMEGTYPLPEAQLDRFFFKLLVPFPSRAELHRILARTTSDEIPRATPVLSRDTILQMQQLVRQVPVAEKVRDYAVRLVLASHPTDSAAPPRVKRFVRTGASPRGAQSLLLAAKIFALFAGRYAPSTDDIDRASKPALRHRILLNFEGEAEGISTDDLITDILTALPKLAD